MAGTEPHCATPAVAQDPESSALYTLAVGGTVRLFAFAPDESLLAAATDADVRLWDMQTGKQRTVVRPRAAPQVLSFSADGRWLLTAATGNKGSAVQVWDVRKGSAAVTVEDPARLPGGVVLSAQGKVLAVLAESGASVSLWRVSEGSLLAAVPLDRPAKIERDTRTRQCALSGAAAPL